MTIREVEEKLGITRANVRFYEKEGLLFPKRNPINDYRDYSGEDVETLKRIIFLRKLEVPIKTIRQLMQGKADMREVLERQMAEFEHQEKKAEEARLICKKMLLQEKISFSGFVPPEPVGTETKKNLKDTLTELWFFWDKLVIWGFFALQIFYTIIVFPLLPAQIPVSWQGVMVTEYKGRGVFFFYLVISMLFMYGMRMILYMWVIGGLRCYLDELNAIVTVGAIGFGFSIQVYTVLYLKGLRISMDAFQLGCVCGYVLIIFLIVLFHRKYKKRNRTAR